MKTTYEHSPHFVRATTLGWASALLCLGLSVAGCGSTDESGSEDSPAAGDTDDPVVLLGQRVQNPDSRNIYLSLLGDLPAGETSRSDAYEFGDVDIHVDRGKIFVFDRETIALTRYRATDAYELVVDRLEDGAEARLSFQQIGLPGFGFSHVFISPTRAYLVDWGEYRVVVWNPATMEVTSTIDLSIAGKDDYTLSDSYLVSPILAEGKVFIAVYVWQDYNALAVHPGAGVVVLDAETGAAPVLLEDARITGASKLFPTDDGRLLVIGDQYSGLYGHFGSEPESAPPAGVLRIDPRGAELDALAFDSDFFVNLLSVTGSPTIYAAYQVDSDNVLLQVWDPAAPMNASTPDDYWAAPEYVYMVVNLATQTARRVDEIPKALAGSVEQFRFDEQLYVQTYAQAGDGVNSDSVVHRVQPETVGEAFRIPGGDLWALERVR